MRATKLSQFGFGVIEALVFSTIASVFVLGTVAMVTQNSWQVKLMNVKIARDNLVSNMRAQMADPKICTQGLMTAVAFAPTTGNTLEIGFTMLSTKVVQKDVSPDPSLNVRSLHLENIANSGLNGSAGFPMKVADLVMDAQSSEVGFGTTTLKPISVGRVYVEVNGTTMTGCFNNDGPFGAAAMACIQMGGVNEFGNSDCNTAGFEASINNTIQTQVKTTLNGRYMTYVMGQTDGIAGSAGKVSYESVVGTAAGFTGSSSAYQDSLISSGFYSSNAAINSADANRNAQVTNLWNNIQATYGVATGAVNYGSGANSNAVAANSTAQGANGTAQNAYNGSVNAVNTANIANSYGTNANAVSQNAINMANAGVNNSNYAVGLANQANGTAQGANGTAGYANYVASVAANTAQSSYNYGTSAYNSANYAYGTQMSSYNTANAAASTSSWAQQSSWNTNNTVNAAYNTAVAAYYSPLPTYNLSNTAYDCSQMGGQACP